MIYAHFTSQIQRQHPVRTSLILLFFSAVPTVWIHTHAPFCFPIFLISSNLCSQIIDLRQCCHAVDNKSQRRHPDPGVLIIVIFTAMQKKANLASPDIVLGSVCVCVCAFTDLFSLFASDLGGYAAREDIEAVLQVLDGEVPNSLKKCFTEVSKYCSFVFFQHIQCGH